MAYGGANGGNSKWKVVHTRVIIRKAPSTSASILGFHAQGKIVEGSLHAGGSTPWLKVHHHGMDGQDCEGYMLVDGTSLGLGVLLERLNDSTAAVGNVGNVKVNTKVTPKAKANGTRPKDQVNVDELAKWIRHRPMAIRRYDVIVSNIMVRSLPSTAATPVGVAKKGEILEGEPREGWLLLDSQHSVERLQKGEGRWVLMDGKELGLGQLLRLQLPVPVVTKTFANALQLSFDQDVSKYHLQLEPEIGDSFQVQCPSEGTSMLVHGLHSDCHVRLRFALNKDEGPFGEWEAVETTFVPDWEEADGPCVDLLGNPRGNCKQCSCKCFALEEQVVSLNMDVGDSRCARCGCNVTAHVLWNPAEKKATTPATPAVATAKPEPVKPVENPILDKAISLPKDIIMQRWQSMDMDANVKEWPRLAEDFHEVVAWSDLHSDMGKNMTHLRQLPVSKETVLLLAGDVASSLETIESSLRLLKDKFGAVFYVPGNHELWVTKKDGLSSVHKFLAILEICEQLGVHTRPAFINATCAVCPLFSWYKDNLVDGFHRELADIPFDMQTQWPWDITGRGDTNDAQQPEIADFFASLNQRRVKVAPTSALEGLKKAETEAEEAKQAQLEGRMLKAKAKEEVGPYVITMSHFVPRQECYPGPRRLCGVMGCREIEEQVRQCGSRCHIFGHSHISCDREVNGIRYVQHPLGYPNDYHRQSAPKSVWGTCKGRAESVNHKEPDSTIASSICKAILNEIRVSTAECLRRPDGRWNSQDGYEIMSGNIFDRKEELKLRESMGYDAKKMAELWSAPPPLKELEIKLTHYQHENQQLTLSVVNNLLVRQLKERIVEEVGRGQVSKIMLSISGENALNDDVALSSLENEIQGGLLVMGIDMSKGKEVKVKLVHAASDSPQSLTLTVLDTATMLEIRKVAMQRLEESSLSKCKLVRRLATGGFQGLADDERLNKKRELLFLGRELPEDGVKPEGSNGTKVSQVEVSKATKVAAPTKAEVSKKDTNGTNGTAQHKEHKESVPEATANEMQVKITHLLEADQEMHLSVFSDFLVREFKELIVAELGHGSPATIILSSNGDNVLHDQFPLSKYAREIEGGLLITGIELKATAQQPEAPQVQVEVKLVHASNPGQSMNLTVGESCKILDLRRAALSRLGEKSLLNCKIVKRAGSTFASLPDGEGLKGRREFLFLGRDLPADGNGPFVDDNKAKEVKVLSTSQQNGILRLLEEIERALQTESVQKNLARSRKENSDPAKVRALLGPLFASACMDPLRKHGTFQVSKKGFEDFFAAVWMCRTRSEIVSVAHRIEGLLGLSAGDWFGIEKK